MTHAIDVAAYLLELAPKPLTGFQLQKLVYYCQAWSVVWDGVPMFDDEVQAWQNGPVTPSLYRAHRSLYQIDRATIGGNPSLLTPPQRQTTETVYRFYGRYDGEFLVELTHREPPWLQAWGDREPDESGNDPIEPDAMKAYYGTFDVPPKTLPPELALGIDLMMTLPADELSLMDESVDYDAGGLAQWVLADPRGIGPFD